ncbi:hypothetical protein [Marinospirillum sp.]|uniref:hypothetical protein n=1 Tax=Marinospirillum sp. TaxID=2183934 RepID=UPI003850FBC5
MRYKLIKFSDASIMYGYDELYWQIQLFIDLLKRNTDPGFLEDDSSLESLDSSRQEPVSVLLAWSIAAGSKGAAFFNGIPIILFTGGLAAP